MQAFAQIKILCSLSLLVIGAAQAFSHPAPQIPAQTWQQAGLMSGFPPAESQQVTKANMGKYPYIRWTLQNSSKLLPVVVLSQNAPVTPLERDLRRNLLQHTFMVNGKPVMFADYADFTSTDAMVVLANGKIIGEWYADGMTASTPHYMASVTKSVTGLLAELLIYRGKLDAKQKVDFYLPELKKSPFGAVTVRQLLDMEVNVGSGETMLPDAQTRKMWTIMGWIPTTSNEGMYQFLPHVKADGKNDEVFHYSSMTTEVAGWLISKVTKQPLEEFFKHEILSKLGAEHVVYTVVDPQAKMLSSAGLNMSARDLARFGQMIANQGKFNNQQIVPQAVIASLFQAGNHQAWQKSSVGQNTLVKSYRSYWYQMADKDNSIMGIGVFGQSLYINPRKNIVIVKFASQPADIIDEYNWGWAQILDQLVQQI